MKFTLFSMAFFFALPVWADQGTSPDISTVVSIDSWKEKEYRPDVGANYRYRASLHHGLKTEAMPWLEVEKLYTGGMGSPVTTKWKTRLDVTTNPKTQKAYSKICGENAPSDLDCEAKMLCCEISDIRWNKLVLLYKIDVTGRSYQCRAPNIPDNNNKTICSVTK